MRVLKKLFPKLSLLCFFAGCLLFGWVVAVPHTSERGSTQAENGLDCGGTPSKNMVISLVSMTQGISIPELIEASVEGASWKLRSDFCLAYTSMINDTETSKNISVKHGSSSLFCPETDRKHYACYLIKETKDFTMTTSAQITYELDIVVEFTKIMRYVANSTLVIFLIILGYQVMYGTTTLAQSFPRVVLAFLLINYGETILTAFIDLNSSLSVAIYSFTFGYGQPVDPFLALGYERSPSVAIGARGWQLLCILLMAILCLVQWIMRIGLLDILLIVHPLAALCLVWEGSQRWSKMWSAAFVGTVIMQFLQAIAICLGSTLVAFSIGHVNLGDAVRDPINTSNNLAALFIGIGAFFFVLKIPGWLGSMVTGTLSQPSSAGLALLSTGMNIGSFFASGGASLLGSIVENFTGKSSGSPREGIATPRGGAGSGSSLGSGMTSLSYAPSSRKGSTGKALLGGSSGLAPSPSVHPSRTRAQKSPVLPTNTPTMSQPTPASVSTQQPIRRVKKARVKP